MSDCQCNTKSCPEPVSTVNVSITEISLGDNPDIFKREAFVTTTASPAYQTFALTFIPYSDAALQIYVNGSLQRGAFSGSPSGYEPDYTRDLQTLTFPGGLGGASTIQAVYFGLEYDEYTLLDGSLRPGVIVGWGGGATAPTGYLLCDGAAVSRTTYAVLYSVIGTTYGAGDGSTTFNLPDVDVNYTSGAGQATGPALIKI